MTTGCTQCDVQQMIDRLPDYVWLAIKQKTIVANPSRVGEVVLSRYEVEDASCPVSNQQRILHHRQTNNLIAP